MIDGIGPLFTQLRTLFLLSEAGRIERENDPDGSHGPRLWLAGSAFGNVVGVGSDVDDGVATEIEAVAATEPPFADRNGVPKHLDRYVDLLSQEAETPRQERGLTYVLPHRHPYESRVKLVDGDSPEGRRLSASFAADGMPDGLAALGFRSVADLWPPWCVVLVDGEAVSVAFAARISAAGAELGVATAEAFRGRGYAAAAAAGWSALPALRSRMLFYSADQANASSRRVVSRLGLPFLGANVRFS